MIGSSLVFSAWTLVSRLMGFARDIVLTSALGASATAAADAFYTALSFPNLFRRIFAEGAFAAAFVPAYARKLEGDGEDAADALASDALATIAAVTLALSLAAMLAMPWLMLAINPGYSGDKFKLAVMLTTITMPYLPCMAIVALLSGVLNARHRFALSAGVAAVLNIVMLIAVLPQHEPIAAAKAASWGVLVAGIIQATMLFVGARRQGAKIRLRLPRLTPEIKALIGLAIPGAIAASATQINIFVSQALASMGEAGARAWLNVADRLYQLPLGLVGVAVGVALLPRLAMAVQAKDHDGARDAMDEALTFTLALTLPAAAALFAMPVFLIDGLFTRGAFHAYDAQQTALALLHYGWGTPAFVLVRILTPAFFARLDTKAPMRFALISVVANIVLGVGLFQVIGFSGIAAATSAASWLNVTMMWMTLRKRGDYTPTKQAVSRWARIALSAGIMGALLFAAQTFRPMVEAPFAGMSLDILGHHVLGPKEYAVAAVALAGVALYALLLPLTGAITPADLKRALKRDPKAKAAAGTDLL
ncbi:murein biosynthesis integral membrane protein MurJ [Caulobacter sp. 17J65-9]|nr:murein biosynthesis integral membrane protein MurJ [Caulobacter sp. 17J65-9]NEX92288.1 murein biosynthesis integral membrane protein MurJ [Caulobacter sp. 17J65-9]